MSSRTALDLSTRKIKIYASAYDSTARAGIEEHLADTANPHAVDAADVGLGNVVDLAPAALPISDATAAALALKAPLLNPALSGVPTAPTAPPGTVTTQLATAAFVQAAITALDVPDVAADLAAHVANSNNPHLVDKADVGLGAADNTADAAKPVSAAQQTAINAAAAIGTAAQVDIDGHQSNVSNPHATTKAQVGLGSVDNTADLAKPVSTATQAAINTASAATATVATNLATHTANVSNPHATTKAQIGLSAVVNLAPADLPVSTATQAAINVVAGSATAAQADIDGHQALVNNPHTVTKAQVGLGNVSNLAPADLPVSTATQTAINAAVAGTGTVAADLAAHTADTDNPHAVSATDVGLGAVDNTADLDKPISTATQTALNLQAAEVDAATAAVAAAQAAADAAQADADAAAADAAAAQADATQAIADAAAAQADADAALVAAEEAGAKADALISGAFRPGDAVGAYGETKIGEPSAVVPIDPAWVVVSAAGSVVRVTAATADDPQTVAPAAAYALDPGRIYEARWRVQRVVNPVDPLNDSVTMGLQWLTSAKAGNGSVNAHNLALVVADGIVQRTARVGIAPPAAAALDHTAPANTVYVRPYVDTFGDAHTTDLITIELTDITASADPAGITVAAPVSGAVIVMTDLRPLYVNNAATLAALTVRLPPGAAGYLCEVGFARPVTALTVTDAASAPVAGSPVNAYGPGAALQFRHTGTAWVPWK